MAIVCKSFIHNRDKILGESGGDDGILPEDIEDYITSQDATLGSSTNLNVTCTNLGNGTIFTLVIMDDD